ncbi:ArsR family transcriptional regulator [bacterium]|nr:MAG: ArsR family transcriptional regulator [bacterium]RIK61832.1 MAG: transcriptional regulator [Planctomycetota bacterium]
MVLAAIAHPARRQILLTLKFRGGTMTAGEIAARFECAWPTTTRHLQVLLAAGLVKRSRRGRKIEYRVEERALRLIYEQWLKYFG